MIDTSADAPHGAVSGRVGERGMYQD